VFWSWILGFGVWVRVVGVGDGWVVLPSELWKFASLSISLVRCFLASDSVLFVPFSLLLLCFYPVFSQFLFDCFPIPFPFLSSPFILRRGSELFPKTLLYYTRYPLSRDNNESPSLHFFTRLFIKKNLT